MEVSPDVLAAIDVGTNSIHMVVARVGEGGTFEVVDRAKEVVRLGSSGGDMKRLEPDAIERGVAALGGFRRLAESFGAHIIAVATSAVREAENAATFLERAREEAGVVVEVISGFEEGRLIHLGAMQALPLYGRRHLVLDIGGGSTEVVVADGGDDELVRSVKLGAIRLTQRFFAAGESSADVAACRRYVRSVLEPIVHELGGPPRPEVAVGTSGTIESVVAMALLRRSGDAPRSRNGVVVAREEVDRVVDDLVRAGSADGRRALAGLEPRRADIVLAGALVLEGAMEVLHLDAVTFSDFALREGVLFDAIERVRGSARHHLQDLRRRSVLHLQRRCNGDPEHAAHVAALALQLFDALAGELELSAPDRELLEAAALLCNVGLFVSHAQHHKHSYYVIRNSEHLLGFTEREIELIALVARYHRKSAPKADHPEFAALDAADQERVRRLAAILRVALALDRGHTGAVRAVRVEVARARVLVEAQPASGTDGRLDLALYSAAERSGLLADVLGRSVEVATA